MRTVYVRVRTHMPHIVSRFNITFQIVSVIFQIAIVGNTQILHINKVEPSDEGFYVCTICNSSGGTVETNPTELILST